MSYHLTTDSASLYVPSCMRCGSECLSSEVHCFACQLEMEQVIAEDIEMEHE